MIADGVAGAEVRQRRILFDVVPARRAGVAAFHQPHVEHIGVVVDRLQSGQDFVAFGALSSICAAGAAKETTTRLCDPKATTTTTTTTTRNGWPFISGDHRWRWEIAAALTERAARRRTSASHHFEATESRSRIEEPRRDAQVHARNSATVPAPKQKPKGPTTTAAAAAGETNPLFSFEWNRMECAHRAPISGDGGRIPNRKYTNGRRRRRSSYSHHKTAT